MSINAFYGVEVISTGVPQSIPMATSMEGGQAFIAVRNVTGHSATGLSSTLPVATEFYPNGSDGATFGYGINNSGALVPVSLTSGGISVGTTAPMQSGTPIAITAITAANPAVVTCADTSSLSSGQDVWIAYATGMSQIAQMPFTIEVLSGTTFSLKYLNASGFSSPATVGSVVPLINYGAATNPFTNFITSISSVGLQTEIVFSVAQNFQVGQMIQVYVPTNFGGMQELNLNTGQYSPSNLGGYQITAVNASTNTVTINVNSSSFGAFAFPSNAVALVQPAGIIQSAQASISGTYWGNLTDVGSRNTNTWYLNLGSAVCGRNGDVLQITYGWLGA